MSTTLSDYARLALRTEAPLSPESLSEVQVEGLRKAQALLLPIEQLGVVVDFVKKGAIYGKIQPEFHLGLDIDPLWPMERRALRLLHAILGISGEASELATSLRRSQLETEPLDVENIKEEIGDVLWYLALAADAIGADLGDIADANIRKLAVRLGPTYDADRVLNRDLEAEKAALEGASLDREAILRAYIGRSFSTSSAPLRSMIEEHPAVIASGMDVETMDGLVRQILDEALTRILPFVVQEVAKNLDDQDFRHLAKTLEADPVRDSERKVFLHMATPEFIYTYTEALNASANEILTPLFGDGTKPLPEG